MRFVKPLQQADFASDFQTNLKDREMYKIIEDLFLKLNRIYFNIYVNIKLMMIIYYNIIYRGFLCITFGNYMLMK